MPVWEGTTKATGIFFWEVLHIWTLNLLQTLKMLMEFLSSLLLNTYNELLKILCLDIQCILLDTKGQNISCSTQILSNI